MAEQDAPKPDPSPGPSPAATTRVEPPALSGPPERIGNYHIRRVIGTGGMGEVYEAMQEHPRRSVALKVMRPGVTSASALRRFEYESQVLARLQHPGIAQIFEAGTYIPPGSSVPVPFFAMEYIALATPITQYAREHGLDTRRRLELMARVCEAVAHGHSKGIIHRDLKPSNILVDAEGNPKIIDFGVARGTDSDMALTTLQTSAGQIIGTLQYMSPEQCSSDPRALDHRSDIYSLGIILYELLCERLPYDVGSASIAEATRIIREAPRPRPSTINRSVRGDPETIILRAIDKDRERRYQSAVELKADIERHLAGEPILARPDSLGYVIATSARRAASRNRSLAVLLTVVAAAVLVQTIGVEILSRWNRPIRAFEVLCISWLAPTIASFEHVRLIALTDSTDIGALAAAESLEGIDPANVKSFRRLHGRLLERLAPAQPGVVVLDIKFRDATPFDADLAAGARRLESAGTDTVVACQGWELDADGAPRLSPTLAAAMRWGSAANWVSPTEVWRLQLAVRPEIGETMMSLTLRSLACLAHPGLDASARIDEEIERLLVQSFRSNPQFRDVRAPEGEPIVIPLTVRPMLQDEPGYGLHTSELVASYQIDPPPDGVYQQATWDYAKAFTATPESLHAWCAHKAVIVYDARADIDRHGHPSGRTLPGAYAQAIGVEQLVRRSAVRTPSLLVSWIVTLASAALGALAVVRARGALIAVAAACALLSCLFLVCLALYRFDHLLINPISHGLALVLSTLIVPALPGARRQGLTVRHPTT